MTGHRSHKAEVLASGELAAEMMIALVSRLRDELTSQNAPRTEQAASLIFAVYLRAAALVCYEVEVQFAAYPYKLVLLLCPPGSDEDRHADWEEQAASFRTCPPCCLDTFSAELLRRFPMSISLQSVSRRFKHSSWSWTARHTLLREPMPAMPGNTTHELTLAQTAVYQAEATPHSCHRFQCLKSSHGHAQQKRKRSDLAEGEEGKDEKDPKSRRGSGGAWRALLHCRAQGAGRKDFGHLATEYRDLSLESHRRYQELGQEATALRRQHGLVRAFPVSDGAASAKFKKRSDTLQMVMAGSSWKNDPNLA